MPNNKERKRRFGSIRKTSLGEFQASYLGPDSQRHFAPHRFKKEADADRWLSKVEGIIIAGDWTDPERVKIPLGDYAEKWITERPNLRPRTVELYRWLLSKHIAPYLGTVQLGKLSAAIIRQWRADRLTAGVSASCWPRHTGCSGRCSTLRLPQIGSSHGIRARCPGLTRNGQRNDRCCLSSRCSRLRRHAGTVSVARPPGRVRVAPMG